MHAPVLELHDLALDALGPSPRRLVDGLSLSIAPGKTLALVGESGAGKSLTALAVMHLLPPGVRQRSGRMCIAGRDVAACTPEDWRRLRNSVVSMIMQHPMSAFDPVWTIRAHFAETLRDHTPGLSGKAIEAKTLAALAEAGFSQPETVLDVYPFQMSGGMLQRVMIAIALLGNPLLLIADEATTDLDAVLQSRIVQLLRERKAARNLSMLLITHDLSVAAALADDVAVMHQGRVVESGPIAQVFAAPCAAYTRMLLAAHHALHGDVRAEPTEGPHVAA